MAYIQDPYPNQTTIEELAAELNIGVKTVVNWFHNHRMRAKQQQHSGNSDSGQMSIKSEPMDDNSNQSELSSFSGDMEPNFSHYSQGDTGQWMFPQFEPVYSKSQEEIAANKPNQDCHEEIKISKETGGCQETETTQNLQQPTSAAVNGVNKRKRGNPKWAYEGTQLDKTMERLHVNARSRMFADTNANTSEGSVNAESEITPSDANLNETIASEDSGDETSLDSEDERLFQERANKIKKMQKAIETTEAFWDECDASASIEKLEKSLAEESEEDWEF